MSERPTLPYRPNLPYRPCVGIMLLNRSNEVFVGQRIDQKVEAWQMPQGGIDEGETPVAAARRELREEVGTELAEIIAETSGWLCYDLPADLVGRVWGGRFCGQRQKWFLMRFTGSDSDIRIDTEEPEFKSWRWLAPHLLPDMIVPFKKALYEQILDEFSPLLSAA